MVTYKIFFLRHGLTQGNLDGRFIGVTDLPLCKQGEEQIKKILDSHEYPQVQKVYTSPLQRCTQTCELIYPESFTEQIPQLREYNFGDFENKTSAELNQNPDFIKWDKSFMATTPPNGESKEDFDKRIEEGFERILKDMMKLKITSAAVITHSGVIMSLLSKYGLPKRNPILWTCENGFGYTVVVNPYLWSQDKLFEVYSSVPYSKTQDNNFKGYQVFDLDQNEDGE